MMTKKLTTGCTLPRMMMGTSSIISAPKSIGSERRTNTINTENRSETNQHLSVSSIPSSRIDACTVKRKTTRNQMG